MTMTSHPPQPHSAIRLAIVGLGRAGWSMHTAELAKRGDRFRIVAACDVDPARAALAKARYGCAAYTRFAEVLADPEVEVVDIATPSPEHTPMALAALAAGKRVFLEKPIALTYRDALKLQAAAAKRPGRLFFRHNRRFESGFVHIQEIIASGVLGRIHLVRLRRNGYQRRNDWQTLIACGGGQLNNWGPHIIDHALRFLGSPVASVWSDLKKVAAVGDAEDHLKIVLTGKNGMVADLEISGGAAITEPECMVFGSRGALSCNLDQITVRYLDPKVALAPRKASRATPPAEGPFGAPDHLTWVESTFPAKPASGCDTDAVWDHLYAAIRHRRPFPVTIAQAVEVVRIGELARKGTSFAGATRSRR